MLTIALLKNATPKDKPYRLTDGRGLHLLVHSGGGKYWQFRYRINGKEKVESLGVFPEVGLREARDKREELKALLRAGADPGAIRRARRRERDQQGRDTFKCVALEWFDVWKKGKDAETVAYKLRRIEGDLFPRLGERPIAEITRREVIETIKSISSRGVGDTARRALQVTKAIFSYAVTHEFRDSDLLPRTGHIRPR